MNRAVRTAGLALLLTCAIVSSPAVAFEFEAFDCTAACIRSVAGHVLGLRSFDLSLTSDDRHVKDLVIVPNARTDGPRTEILLSMHDENAGPSPLDFHTVEMAPAASFYDLTEVGRFAEARLDRCDGDCRLGVDLAPGETFILTGFLLAYLDDGERDHHVRRISILPGRDSEGAHVIVAMQDNDGRRPISVVIHYAAVSDRHIAAPGYVDTGQLGVEGVFSSPRTPGPAVLTGFSVNWMGEDHHFKRLMVDLSDDRVQAAFHDNDVNRRFESSVYFVVLREPDD